MPIMTWDSSLDVGVAAMNHEHQDILDAMNRIYDASEAGRTGDEINRLVARLGTVCADHFRDEEAYMARIDYPARKNHGLIHEELLTRFTHHAAEIRAAGGRADGAFFHFLRHWLTSHIKGIDRKYGEHAASGRHAA